MPLELNAAEKIDFKTICLKDGFDLAFLNVEGQHDFNNILSHAGRGRPFIGITSKQQPPKLSAKLRPS